MRDNLRTVLTRAERAQTLKLLNLQLYDLHMKEEATKTAARWGVLLIGYGLLGSKWIKNKAAT